MGVKLGGCEAEAIEEVNLSGEPRVRFRVKTSWGGVVYVNVRGYSMEEAVRELKRIVSERIQC